MRLLFLIAITITCLACKKEKNPIVPLPPEEERDTLDSDITSEGKLKIVWQTLIAPDSSRWGISFQPLAFHSNVLFSLETAPNNNLQREKLIMLDGLTGERLWEWDDYPGIGDSPTRLFARAIVGDKLVFNSQNEVCVINLLSGTAEWCFDNVQGNGKPAITVFGNSIFHVHESRKDTANYLVRGDVDFNGWDTLFVLRKEDGFQPGMHPPGIWIHPNTLDTVLVFQNRKYKWPDTQMDIYAWNMTTGKVEFVLYDIDPEGVSNIAPPLIWENKAYFAGRRTMYCIDLFEGKILWSRRFSFQEMLNWTNYLIEEDVLVVNPTHFSLYGLDPRTGDIIWHEPNSGATCGDMVYHDGIVYFGCLATERLYAVDIHTGEHIWAELSPNKDQYPDASFAVSVAVNPQLGYLYAMDFHYAMCIELPQR